MSDNGQQFSEELNYIYATLDPYHVEQFYIGYKLWWTQQRLSALQEQIGRLRLEMSENAQRLQQVQPPAVAFATLVRLQAKGVNDIELLDRMLERGEEWLDLTMQRLDYCEQLDFIHDNYIQWCEHALDGAYDWIDSMRDTDADTVPRPVVAAEVNEANVEATEELLLSKLTSEEETSSVESTLKRPVVSPNPTADETLADSERQDDVAARVNPASEEEPISSPLDDQHQEPPLQEPEMVLSAETKAGADSSFITAEQAKDDEYVEYAPPLEALTEEVRPREASSLQETFLAVEEPATISEASFPSEVEVGDSTSTTATEQANGYVEFVPTVLHPETINGIDELINSDKPEEPRLYAPDTNHDSTNVQLTLPEYRNQPIPGQELKVQRRPSLRRRLLAIFWP
jgi:hypothetical protein